MSSPDNGQKSADPSRLDDFNTHETAHSGAVGFSISRLLLLLMAMLLIAAGLLWAWGWQIPSFSDEIHLDEAHLHGRVSSVGAELDGRISELNVELGDSVEAGDIVARLQDNDLEAQADAASQALEQRRLELESATLSDEIASRQSEAALERAKSALKASAARLSAAKAENDLRQSEFQRVKTLVTRGAMPQANLDTAREAADAARTLVARRKAELEVSRSEVAAARIRIQKDELRAVERDVMRAEISLAESELDRLLARLAYTNIQAFESGIVVALPARLGASVSVGDPILDLWRTDRLWVRAWVSEDQVARIKPGDRVKIHVSAVGDKTFDGTVDRILVSQDGREQNLPGAPISPLLPEESRFAVQVRLYEYEEFSSQLLPGMSADVRIIPSPSLDGSQNQTE
jgi:multidrug resistance efflux pump